jgi:hypothetical protein
VKYNTPALVTAFPNAKAHTPYSPENPALHDFLRHGYLTDLCAAILDDELPEPYKTLALAVVPPAAMIAVMCARGMEAVQAAADRAAKAITDKLDELPTTDEVLRNAD